MFRPAHIIPIQHIPLIPTNPQQVKGEVCSLFQATEQCVGCVEFREI